MTDKYVWRSGAWINKRTGEPMPEIHRDEISLPAIIRDYETYISPITKQPVEGRAAHREELKKHGCRILEKGEIKATYRNEAFCKKRGIEVGTTVT